MYRQAWRVIDCVQWECSHQRSTKALTTVIHEHVSVKNAAIGIQIIRREAAQHNDASAAF